MSDDREDWEWAMVGVAPFGPIVAQICEVTGPGRHFLLRRACGIAPGKPAPDGMPSFQVLPSLLPVQFLCEMKEPWVVYPHALLFQRKLSEGNERAMDEMFSTVKAARPGDIPAAEQVKNRLTLLEGRNGG